MGTKEVEARKQKLQEDLGIVNSGEFTVLGYGVVLSCEEVVNILKQTGLWAPEFEVDETNWLENVYSYNKTNPDTLSNAILNSSVFKDYDLPTGTRFYHSYKSPNKACIIFIAKHIIDVKGIKCGYISSKFYKDYLHDDRTNKAIEGFLMKIKHPNPPGVVNFVFRVCKTERIKPMYSVSQKH